ncbi:MAG: AAA family ATPase [Clostridiales bacterium]|nr:AAA family ATPase [Clostridiales bacterium]
MKKQFKPLVVDNVKNLADKEFETIDPLIDHFLPGKGLYLLCGSAKVGKSWLALQIALCVSTGMNLWTYDTRKKEVLYLCLEDGERRLQDRLYSIANDCPREFMYSTEAAPIGGGLEEQLEDALEAHPNIGLFIIDTLAAVRCERNKADINTKDPYQGDYNTIAPLHNFCEEHNVTILLIHHTRKMRSVDPFDDILGTNGLFGASDGAFIFRKESDDSDVKIRIRSRDMEERVLTVRFNSTLSHWELVKENTPVEDAFQTDEDLKKALDYLKEHGSFDGKATEFCDLIKASKKPQSISGKMWNRRSDLAKLGFSFDRDHKRDGTYFTFARVDPQAKKGFDTELLGCYPFDLVTDDYTIELRCYGGNKVVTSSQSSQTA